MTRRRTRIELTISAIQMKGMSTRMKFTHCIVRLTCKARTCFKAREDRMISK
jgi:hypothetical protein